jgi:hypothetical protein
MSKDTINYHYEHLAKGYAKRYNAGEGDKEFNRAGSFLHNKFFPQLQPPKGANRPKGAVLELIETNFKTYEDFKIAFKEAAMKIQGSGWVYLSTAGTIKTIPNHQPTIPFFAFILLNGSFRIDSKLCFYYMCIVFYFICVSFLYICPMFFSDFLRCFQIVPYFHIFFHIFFPIFLIL